MECRDRRRRSCEDRATTVVFPLSMFFVVLFTPYIYYIEFISLYIYIYLYIYSINIYTHTNFNNPLAFAHAHFKTPGERNVISVKAICSNCFSRLLPTFFSYSSLLSSAHQSYFASTERIFDRFICFTCRSRALSFLSLSFSYILYTPLPPLF